MQNTPTALLILDRSLHKPANPRVAYMIFRVSLLLRATKVHDLLKPFVQNWIESAVGTVVFKTYWITYARWMLTTDTSATRRLGQMRPNPKLHYLVKREISLIWSNITPDPKAWSQAGRLTLRLFLDLAMRPETTSSQLRTTVVSTLLDVADMIGRIHGLVADKPLTELVRVQLEVHAALVSTAFALGVQMSLQEKVDVGLPFADALALVERRIEKSAETICIAGFAALQNEYSSAKSFYDGTVQKQIHNRLRDKKLDVSQSVDWLYAQSLIPGVALDYYKPTEQERQAAIRAESDKKFEEMEETKQRKERLLRARTAHPNYNDEQLNYEINADPYDWSKFGQVYVGKSQISKTVDTGRGVFALVDFFDGDVITEFCGKYYTTEPAKVKKDETSMPYLRMMRIVTERKKGKEKTHNVYIDGEPNIEELNQFEVAQLIQDPRDRKYVNSTNVSIPDYQIPEKYRDRGCQRGKRVPKDIKDHWHAIQVATTYIPAGTEIYTSYNYSRGNRYDPAQYEALGMIAKEKDTEGMPPPEVIPGLRRGVLPS